jgi:hypothetical protein
MAGKFQEDARRFGVSVGEVFNRAMRQALIAGLAMAIERTKHDSSNAAAHWMLGARTKSRPATRQPFGTVQDLRRTRNNAGYSPIGSRGDHGANAAAVLKFVREREIQKVLDQYLVGRKPPSEFFFYNAVADMTNPAPGQETSYAERANIKNAGEAAVQATLREVQNRIAAGQARKNPL